VSKAKLIVLTGAGAGYLPWAPGTCGTFVGLLLYILFWHRLTGFFYLLFTLFFLLLGAKLSDEGEDYFSQKDSPYIVVDEIVGILVAFWGIPFGFWSVILGFLLFRIWDIWKPFGLFEDISGGWGVMLDDVVAGILTNLMLRVMF